MKFTEPQLEQAFISLLEEQGYPRVYEEEIASLDKKGLINYLK